MDLHLINFGPQHPAAHGVLRLILALDGEVIKKADPHIGLLHRGTEKLREQKTSFKALPYRDRLDYVTRRVQEYVFSLGIEKLLNVEVPLRAQYIRVIFLEITRLLNHLRALTTHALDVGALTPFLWGFQEREYLLELYERVSGARRHASYIRPGGVYRDLPLGTLDKILEFCSYFENFVVNLQELLALSPVFISRLKSIGVLNSSLRAQNLGFSGPLNRNLTKAWDLRQNFPSEIYTLGFFNSLVGRNADCLDRYFMRVAEMKESLYIIKNLTRKIASGPCMSSNLKISFFNRRLLKDNRENLIYHFKRSTEGPGSLPAKIYSSVEAPKGETGVFIINNTDCTQYRVKLRTPGFFHLQGLHPRIQNQLLADAVAVIGTQDIVFGEVDR